MSSSDKLGLVLYHDKGIGFSLLEWYYLQIKGFYDKQGGVGMEIQLYYEQLLRDQPGYVQQLLKGFFHNTMVGQALMLPSGTLLANHALCRILGYTVEELVRHPWSSFVAEEDQAKAQAIFAQLMSGEKTEMENDLHLVKKDGSVIWVEFYASAHRLNPEEPYQIMVTIIDNTEKRQREDELERYRNLVQTFMDASSDRIFLKDDQFRFVLVNQTTAKTRGLQKNDYINHTDFDLMPQKEAQNRRRNDEEVLKHNRLMIWEESVGDQIIETRKFPVVLETGKTGVGGFGRDITQEVQQREMIRKMSEANRIINRCMTDDFRSVDEQLEYAIEEAKRLTDSQFGFIYTYNETKQELQLQQYTDKGMASCMLGPKKSCCSLNEAGLWGEAVRQRKTLVVDDYATSPLKKELPQGHLSVVNFMSIPLFDRQKIVAVIGLANKAGAYSESDISVIQALMNGVRIAILKKVKEKETEALLTRLEAMFNRHGAVMYLLEAETGRFVDANPACLAFYGYTHEEILKMYIYDINAMGKTLSDEYRKYTREHKQGRFMAKHKLKSGELRSVDMFSCSMIQDGKELLFTILFDVTEQEIANQQVHYLAYHDHLTGLYNRRFFEETYANMLVSGSQYPIGILIGDINGLKMYNDTYGHLKGDEAMCHLIARLKEHLEPRHLLARIGGDEFAIIMPKASESEVRTMVYHLEEVLDAEKEGQPLNDLGISFGYSMQRHPQDPLDRLFKEAEAFMYHRKYFSSRSFRSRAIQAIMETLFSKSDRERKHSERVSHISERIAKAMKLDPDTVDKIRVAGLLHDIGKIGVDEILLNKPDKLDREEWEMVKLHSSKGANILSNTMEFHEMAHWIIAHHERVDGQGYPNHLAQEQIPLASRIIAVADAYEAMTTPKPYREALTGDEAVEELLKGAGSHWDAGVVEIFIQHVFRKLN